MYDSPPAETLEKLAANVGEAVYIDVAKWHLYLNDAKLHTLVAQRLYPLVVDDRLSESDVTAVLRDITVPVGGGRHHMPLIDLIPVGCMSDLLQALEDFQDQI